MKIKLYGCGDCGSEFKEKEVNAIKKENCKDDNGNVYTCQFCSTITPLEYLGEFSRKELLYAER